MLRNYTILSLILAATLFSCTRKNDVITPPAAPVAGKGGKARLQVTPQHHGNNVNNGMVYVKYNAIVKPGDTVSYDDSMAVNIIDQKPVAIFDSLRQGSYYFYAMGFDTDPKVQDTVIGGGVFVVPDTVANNYNLLLNVSELHGH